MILKNFNAIFKATKAERQDLFLATASRLNTNAQYVEKDFWVCWILNALFYDMSQGSPRLVFRGGTSLSKSFGLIDRFSEDIDITVFRQDIGHAMSNEDMAALSGTKKRKALEAIKQDCAKYVSNDLCARLETLVTIALPDTDFKIEPDPDDGQTLLFWYPRSLAQDNDDYVRPVVKIEGGAKSATHPCVITSVQPYVAKLVPNINLTVDGINTIKPERTFWDKVIILHGLRQWFERKKQLRHAGKRVSRHYYDIHQLMQCSQFSEWQANQGLAMDCLRHTQLAFNSPNLGLDTAIPGKLTLVPEPAMRRDLTKDYEKMSGMIFGEIPDLGDVLDSVEQLESMLNSTEHILSHKQTEPGIRPKY